MLWWSDVGTDGRSTLEAGQTLASPLVTGFDLRQAFIVDDMSGRAMRDVRSTLPYLYIDTGEEKLNSKASDSS